MKLITKFALSLLIVLICFNYANAQSLNARFAGFTYSGNTAYVTIQLQATSTGEQLYAGNLQVSLSGTDISMAGTPLEGTDFTWGGDFDPSTSTNNYDPSSSVVTSTNSGSDISININNSWDFGPDPQPSNIELPTGSDWIDFVTLKFTINDPGGSTTFSFNTAAMESSPPAMDDFIDQNFVGFSDAGMSSNSFTPSELPVTLSSFGAGIANGATRINWTTSSEINNAYFTVQRSQDGNFMDIFNRDGAGNSNRIINYVAYDAQPLPGISYYRLKQTDFNGASKTFNIVSVYNPVLGEFSIQSVSPTAFTDNATLYYKMPADADVRVRVMDVQGKTVEDQVVPSNIGSNTYTFNNTGAWKQGIYIVDMIYDGRETHIKLVKN